MSTDLAPFPDELLTSWYTRRNHYRRSRAMADPKAVRDRGGAMAPSGHPPDHPVAQWRRPHVQRRVAATGGQRPGEAVSCTAARLSRVGMATIHNRARRLAISAAAKIIMVQPMPRRRFCCTSASSHPAPLGVGRIMLLPSPPLAAGGALQRLRLLQLADRRVPARAIAHVLRRVLETP